MSQRADEPGYLERVRAALSALSPIHSASDEARDDGGGESADDGALISRPLEVAARTISGSLERWRRSGGFLQFLRASGRDQLVVLGETVDLEASLEAPLRLRARLVRFFVNGEPVGEVPTGAFDRTVRCRYTPRVVGVHDIRFEVLDRADAVIIARATTDRVVLQVVDAAPVLAVHGDLLLAEPALDLSPLRALADRGWMIAYFDFDASDRARAARGHGAPAAADRRAPDPQRRVARADDARRRLPPGVRALARARAPG